MADSQAGNSARPPGENLPRNPLACGSIPQRAAERLEGSPFTCFLHPSVWVEDRPQVLALIHTLGVGRLRFEMTLALMRRCVFHRPLDAALSHLGLRTTGRPTETGSHLT